MSPFLAAVVGLAVACGMATTFVAVLAARYWLGRRSLDAPDVRWGELDREFAEMLRRDREQAT